MKSRHFKVSRPSTGEIDMRFRAEFNVPFGYKVPWPVTIVINENLADKIIAKLKNCGVDYEEITVH